MTNERIPEKRLKVASGKECEVTQFQGLLNKHQGNEKEKAEAPLPSELLHRLSESNTVDELSVYLGFSELTCRNPSINRNSFAVDDIRQPNQLQGSGHQQEAIGIWGDLVNSKPSLVSSPYNQQSLRTEGSEEPTVSSVENIDKRDRITPNELNKRFLIILINSINVTISEILKQAQLISDSSSSFLATNFSVHQLNQLHQSHQFCHHRKLKSSLGRFVFRDYANDVSNKLICDVHDISIFTNFRKAYNKFTSFFLCQASLHDVLITILSDVISHVRNKKCI